MSSLYEREIIRYAIILQWFKSVYIMIRVEAGTPTGLAKSATLKRRTRK